jgi:hypothetical protein
VKEVGCKTEDDSSGNELRDPQDDGNKTRDNHVVG